MRKRDKREIHSLRLTLFHSDGVNWLIYTLNRCLVFQVSFVLEWADHLDKRLSLFNNGVYLLKELGGILILLGTVSVN